VPEDYWLFQHLLLNVSDISVHLTPETITSQRRLRNMMFPETVKALSIVSEGYKNKFNSTQRATTDAGDKPLNIRIYLVNTT